MKPVAMDIFAAIAAAGGRVMVVGGDRLKLVAAEPLPIALIERVREHKAELLEALYELPPTPDPGADACGGDDAVERDERAAIIEYDGDIRCDWAEAFAKFHPSYPPPNVTQNEWIKYIDACGQVADHWVERASEFGWEPKDVFGYDGHGPFPYMGRHSLAWQLGMGSYKLLRLSIDEAFVSNGNRIRILRRVMGYSELVWKLNQLFALNGRD